MQRNDPGLAPALLKADTIALISHISPDGDTIGSTLALRLALMQLGKSVRVFCQDKVPDNLMMLSGADAYQNENGLADEDRFDLCCSVDVSAAHRMGRCACVMDRADVRCVIDHHGTNKCEWGSLVLLDGDAPACALLIYDLLQKLGVSLTADMAACLYAGISTDTGNFSYTGITADTFRVQAALMETGFDMSEINRRLFREKALPHLMLIKKALQSMSFYADGRITVTRVTRADMEECHALPEHADNVVNYGLEIQGVQMTLFAREAKDGSIKMSLRGIPGHPVDKVAQTFGGGGHDLAAGITLPGSTLDAWVDKVLARMLEEMK